MSRESVAAGVERDRRVLTAIRAAGHAGVMAPDLEPAVTLSGSAIREAVRRLVEDGSVTRDGPRGRIRAVGLPPVPAVATPAQVEAVETQERRSAFIATRAAVAERLRARAAQIDLRVTGGAPQQRGAVAGYRATLGTLADDVARARDEAELNRLGAQARDALRGLDTIAQTLANEERARATRERQAAGSLAVARADVARLRGDAAVIRRLYREGQPGDRPVDVLPFVTVDDEPIAYRTTINGAETRRGLRLSMLPDPVPVYRLTSSFDPSVTIDGDGLRTWGAGTRALLAPALRAVSDELARAEAEERVLAAVISGRPERSVVPVEEQGPTHGPPPRDDSVPLPTRLPAHPAPISTPVVGAQEWCTCCGAPARFIVTHRDGSEVITCRADRQGMVKAYGPITFITELAHKHK